MARIVSAARGAVSFLRISTWIAAVGLCAVSVARAETTGNFIACQLRAYDSSARFVAPESSNASLSRTLPPSVASGTDGGEDADALSWVAACPRGAVPKSLTIDSFRPSGEPLDGLRAVTLAPAPCPPDVPKSLECAVTPPIRATVDIADRAYPTALGRSLCAEVGGKIVVSVEGGSRASLLVGGPRLESAQNADRYRGRLRFHVVRASPGGSAAVGGDDEGARSVARAEARTASMIWGQCGVHFGPDSELEVEVVDPPPSYLIAVGCDVGLPASGGVVAFGAGDKPFHVATRAGDPPTVVAHAVAHALSAAGFAAVVSPNARIQPGALRTADVLVRDHQGSLVDVTALPGEPLSSDATLGVCLGSVTTSDGITHFDDQDAISGTLEERTLVKAYEDGDPSTIDVFVIPSFGKTGRIGESFIDMDGSGIQNVVIVDRGGIRAGSRSYALAHEIGHVLLDLPGHPDDFGVDRPWELMDADAADATVFGPRRLSFEDCKRAVRQSGPGSAARLLVPWPLHEQKAKQILRAK
jgi:hypothetical protein